MLLICTLFLLPILLLFNHAHSSTVLDSIGHLYMTRRNIDQHREIYVIIWSYWVTPYGGGGIYEPFCVSSFVSCMGHNSAQRHYWHAKSCHYFHPGLPSSSSHSSSSSSSSSSHHYISNQFCWMPWQLLAAMTLSCMLCYTSLCCYLR